MSERLRALDDRVFAKSGGPLFAPTVGADEWVAETDAAGQLGMSLRRLRAGPLAVGAVTCAA